MYECMHVGIYLCMYVCLDLLILRMMVRGKDWNHSHKNKLGYHRQNQPFNDTGVWIPTLVLEGAGLIYIIFKFMHKCRVYGRQQHVKE